MLSGKIEESEKLAASFPGGGSPTSEHEYAGRDWYLFSRVHDIIGTIF